MMRSPARTVLIALPLLAGCATYSTQVTPTPGAPPLAPLPRAEVMQTKPPTAGAEVARIEAQGSDSANAGDCGAYLAAAAAKIGSPVVVSDPAASPPRPGAGPH